MCFQARHLDVNEEHFLRQILLFLKKIHLWIKMLFVLKYERRKTVKTSLRHFLVLQNLTKHLKHSADNSMEHVFYKLALSMFPI
jgi:hypothetical protein